MIPPIMLKQVKFFGNKWVDYFENGGLPDSLRRRFIERV